MEHFNINEMYKEDGTVSRMEHHACMVDLLGQSRPLVEPNASLLRA